MLEPETYEELKYYLRTYTGMPEAYFRLEATRQANGCQPLIEVYNELRLAKSNGHSRRELVTIQ